MHPRIRQQPGELARLAALTTLQLLPHHPIPTVTSPSAFIVSLAATFQRYLDLLRLPPVITHLALLYLHRASSSPSSTLDTRTYSITRLFVMAYSLADTHLDDNAYSNKSWCQVLADGIHIREWNRIQAEMWVRGLGYSLEVEEGEWKSWCTWLGSWWRECGAVEWQQHWDAYCVPTPTPQVVVPVPTRAVVSAAMLPSPAEDEALSYFPAVVGAPSSGVHASPLGVAYVAQQQQGRGSSTRSSTAATSSVTAAYVRHHHHTPSYPAVDEAGYEEDEEEDDALSVLDPEEIADMYGASDEERTPIRTYRQYSVTPDAFTAAKAAMHARRSSEASAMQTAANRARTPLRGILKTSQSTEFRAYDSAYSTTTTPGSTRVTPTRMRKPSVGKVMAEAAEQWWEQTVLRRMSSIRSIGSASSASTAVHSRQSSANWSPATVAAGSGKMRSSKLRKDSAVGGMMTRPMGVTGVDMEEAVY